MRNNKNKHRVVKHNKLRYYSLILAESFDAWRIMPRLMLIAYAVLVLNLYLWYKTIPTYVQEKCDGAVLQILIQNKMPVDEAQKISCTVDNVVGGPTPAQTTLVTTIIGLSSLIFGFYTNSGRKWEAGLPSDAIPPIVTPVPATTPVPTPPAVYAASSNSSLDTRIY